MSAGFLPFARPDVGAEEISEVAEVIRSGWITTGPKTAQFEEEFRDYVGASYALAVNSCTAALHLALEALGVGAGDEVVTTPYTFAATSEVVRYLGARPVFVDIEPESFNLDPELVEAALTRRTKVLLPVHFAGQPARMDELCAIASAHHLAVVEDCAHSLPALLGGKMVGSDLDRERYPGITGHVACFSFYATKCVTTGEGGMLCTRDKAVADRARTMSLHGLSHDAWNRYSDAGSWYYEVVSPGYKYNMPDTAAAMGVVQLRRAKGMWDRRREIAEAYSSSFDACEELETPKPRSGTEHAWHLYPLRLELATLDIDRAAFIKELQRCGVGTSVHFIPLHLHPYYRDEYGLCPKDLPVAHEQFLREISLPIYSRLGDDDVKRVVETVLEVVRHHRRG